jgi:membrane-associated protease RseP (regulator of RpoE activity)
VGARVASGTVPSYLPIGPLPTDVAVTDKNGHFVLRGVAAGEAHIEAYLADRGRAAADHVDVVPGRSTDDVRITFAGEPTTVVEPKGAGSIAVTLAERTEDGKKHLVVILVAANSEAELAGVEPGDRLTAVNGRVVRSLESARESLSGPLAEDVVLELSRDQGSGWRPWMVRVRRERVRR